MEIKINFSLKKYNTLKIDCKTRYFTEIKNKTELIEAFKFAKSKNTPFKIIGKGSNLLLANRNLPYFVAMIINNDIKQEKENFIINTGVFLPNLIGKLVKKNYAVAELAGFPSSIGGAIYGNAGTNGVAIGDFLKSATVFNIKTDQNEIWDQKKFKFAYRYSILKEKKNFIFWEGTFNFPSGENLIKKMQDFLQKRKKSQEYENTAGCIFKNPINNNPKKYSAGYLLEQCQLKGFCRGGAKISEKHANFFINYKNAEYKDFFKLMTISQKKVWDKFKINLEPEIEIWN